MITVDLVEVCSTDSPGITLHVCPREQGERWVPGGRQGTFFLTSIPHCHCCGDPAWPSGRCTKHYGRNPCAIEGCKRSTAAPESGRLADDSWMCAGHWRRYVPPRSRARRAYNRFWNRAKREGWTPELIAKFNRFWGLLVARARRQATEGHLDQREIERMFGWGD